MKKLATLLLSLGFALSLTAQPANDDCPGIIHLGDAPVCPSPVIYTNVNATESNIGMDNFPPCFNGNPQRDVWFSFVATAAIMDYAITVTGVPNGPLAAMSQPQIALYRGDCAVDELVLLDCSAAAAGSNETTVEVQGLTPGITYFIRVNDWSASAAPNWGNFLLCIEENIQTSFTIDEGSTTNCTGSLYDTGGPNGDYGLNENHQFTICPTDPHECIVFTMQQYNVENGFDFITFYDGPNTQSPIISTISGGANGANNGGVCYQVTASSGCLTVGFTSDNIINFEGFQGSWQCTDECPQPGPLTVQTAPNAGQIQTAFTNPLFDINITNINCNGQALGLFSGGDQTNLGLGDGLLLTTGRADQAANPAGFFANNNLGLGGDPDLNTLNDLFGNGFGTDDACSVEMDVFVKTDQLAFDYVFGSDEYKQSFSQFSNDLIGVLVSGPGIPGLPGLNFQENIATLPIAMPNTLVQIQTVNASTNWEFYRNNSLSTSIAYNGLTSGFLGETKTLTASRQVTPCQTYHVKLAIADIDQNDDSGLFIRPSNAGLPELAVNFQTGLDNLVEGCVNVASMLQVAIPEPLTAGTSFNVEIGGTATLNQDYTLAMPSTITFAPGDTLLTFPIQPLPDAIAEGTETIVITLKKNFGCGEIVVATLTIELKDQLEVDIVPGQDTIFVCNGVNTVQLQATGAAAYAWSPAGIFNNPISASPTATIANSQLVTVTGTLGTCTATDQVFLQLISPAIDITAAGSTQLCQGDSVQLTAVNNVGNSGLTWSPTAGLTNPTGATTFAKPFATTTYTATVTTSGCSASDQITVTVEPFSFPAFVSGDTTICQNSSVKLAANVTSTSTTFSWSPTTGLNNPDIAGAVATPDVTTTYTLTATSANGACTETAAVTVTVLPADVDIAPDTLEICLGETVPIAASTTTNGAGLTWSPTDSLTVTGLETVLVNPTISTWYAATLEVGICKVADSVYVRVDSLPAMPIEAIPMKDMYCQGENISLVSPNYPFQQFPDIMHQWSPTTGGISSDTLFNFVINATATTTYIRTTTNHACSAMDTIEIVVVPVAVITVTPAAPVICAGESVQLVATADQVIEEWEWSPAAGLSCTDCPNPTATPPGTITYQVTGEFMGCPAFATVPITILPAPVYQFPANPVICQGESITLNEIVDPTAGYVWTTGSGTIVSTEAQPVVSPNQTTTYQLTIENGQCQPVTDEITVTVIQDYELNLTNSDVTICKGSEVVLAANAGNVSGVTTWSPAGQNGQPVTVNENTTFVVTFTDAGGCFTKTDSFTVMVSEPFEIDTFFAMPDTLFEGDTLDLQAVTFPGSLDGPLFVWQLEGSNFAETTTPTVATTAPQVVSGQAITVVYKVIITDEFGCMAMAFDTVFVKNSAFDMPNVFSPNNDGVNDFFTPVKSDNIAILDFKIWDRWGNKVYDNTNGNAGWDGKVKEKDAVSDVYVFYIRYNEAGVEKVKKGDVTLLR
jgi:gliding motility-associated-like protein